MLSSMIKLTLSIALFALIGQLSFAQEQTKRLSNPVKVTDEFETFGVVQSDDSPIFSLSYLLENQTDFQDTTFVLSTKVGQVCQKKGCFFIAYDGEHSVRVSFKDYSFFVPTDIGGKQVRLQGSLIKREISTS
ncbi:MAG: DUF4920 domain-containing protein [Pseudomonadota bacterium]